MGSPTIALANADGRLHGVPHLPPHWSGTGSTGSGLGNSARTLAKEGAGRRGAGDNAHNLGQQSMARLSSGAARMSAKSGCLINTSRSRSTTSGQVRRIGDFGAKPLPNFGLFSKSSYAEQQ